MKLGERICPHCWEVINPEILSENVGVPGICDGYPFYVCPKCGAVSQDDSWYRFIEEDSLEMMLYNKFPRGCFVCDAGIEIIGLDNRCGTVLYEEFPSMKECLEWFFKVPRWTHEDVSNALRHGVKLESIFDFCDGQECTIYKTAEFVKGDKIIYIPDVSLNDIPTDKAVLDEVEAMRIAGCCYTGDDFIELCDGDEKLAERLFWYCDWQHPSSAYPELVEEEDD